MLAASARSSRALRLLSPSSGSVSVPRCGNAGCRRAASTRSSSAPTTVELAYERHAAPAAAQSVFGSAGPRTIVVAHGLFGSKQNWRSIARAMAAKWGLDVWAVDLRNHGTSPHASSMTYSEHAADLGAFFAQHGLEQVSLVGHSMGGKTVQTLALAHAGEPSHPLHSLVSVDMAPARGSLSPEFARYMDAMVDIEEAKCASRKDADEIMQRTEPDAGVRSFLLTNLERRKDAAHWSFRIPVRSLQTQLPALGDFPFDAPGQEEAGSGRPVRSWDGQTMFVKGAKSKYINRRNIPICNAYFPNAQHVSLDAGHWVQAERPAEFQEVLGRFLRREPLE